jgi:hypothetical protein
MEARIANLGVIVANQVAVCATTHEVISIGNEFSSRGFRTMLNVVST